MASRAIETSTGGWYRLERIDVRSLGTVGERDRLHHELADVYAAAHGTEAARHHFLTRRRVEDFDVIHLARRTEGLLAWLGVSRNLVAGRVVATFDDAVVHPAYQHRGLTRALTLQAFRPIALDALRRPGVIALLTTNPIVAEAVESHLRRDAARYPAIAAPATRRADLAALAEAVAHLLHPDAPFDPSTGVLRDFLPAWHRAQTDSRVERVQRYFDEQVPAGSAVLMLVPVGRAMLAAHALEWAVKSVQTRRERRAPRESRS